ncbi:hypothetical protein [Leeia aquatica]|uniref:Uncharacterized protein n=1 Tax=Leeia aquatica TaxID=2725557 RepID=A0A847S2Q2_9NEIS|nr:hypothetical protein [Leeia aquatica]NLR74034.1 hypothetical protein [Leeia aquatica]
MSKPFLRRSAIVDIIKSRERTQARQRREGLMHHPVYFTICGCPDPACGGWHTIDTTRTLPSTQDCAAIIKAANVARKQVKRQRKRQ